ncbi:hypothetical protein KTO58_21245 [Chitinophaga pendula]|uniref:hypothetical protein n=1 Tax=Chitinophaga TaxID=79328 RepID=UPI000BB07709|nr:MULTISPECIES: hypothetical protein [Chitinophaga]ASZ10843.1 hypothetical protein CK934_07560 [Chitinophaga sp. MD30]UCJ06176.1 hypothetical protein KTO58_21245 [Chitinophaga pendula]
MKKQNVPQPYVNMLQDLHARLFEVPITFRDQVCEECGWSIPTFYRKMKSIDRMSDTGRRRLIPALSNAEKEKIMSVLDEVYLEFWQYCEKYRPEKK